VSPLRPRLRVLAAAIAVSAAATIAACGDSGTSTSTASVAAGGGGSSSCDTAATACSVAGPTPVPPGTTSQACTNGGSGRTDDFHQKVTLAAQPDGLQIGDIVVGTGPALQSGQLVTVEYSGWLQDGTLFDSSRKQGGQPFSLTLGAHQAIPGFEEALTTMHVGGVRRAVIPPALGYGASGTGPIPPNATLTFDLEVLCAA
jgi:FKBP-type peptidyl-prolyl cis-trans isomerase FkpA